MNKESRTLVIVPGENIRRGQGRDYLLEKTRKMGPSAKITAIAGGIVATNFEENADILTQAGDAAGLGITEAEQNANYISDRFPNITGNIHLETDSFDSPSISNNAHNFIHQSLESGTIYERVVLVDIDSHLRRMTGQMEAHGVPLDGTYSAEGVYLNDPNPKLTESSKIRRQRVIDRMHKGTLTLRKTKPHDIFNPSIKNGLISKQMLMERIFEAGLNLIGIVDNKGHLAQRFFTSRTRKNAA